MVKEITFITKDWEPVEIEEDAYAVVIKEYQDDGKGDIILNHHEIRVLKKD